MGLDVSSSVGDTPALKRGVSGADASSAEEPLNSSRAGPNPAGHK